MTKGNDLIGPVDEYGFNKTGLTKREYFAALALQGLLTKYSLNTPSDQKVICQMAVELSDSLINELNT